jgi:hypothetical protein
VRSRQPQAAGSGKNGLPAMRAAQCGFVAS